MSQPFIAFARHPRRLQVEVFLPAGHVAAQCVELTASPLERSSRTKDLYGFRPFPKRGGVVTNELIDKLREAIKAATTKDVITF